MDWDYSELSKKAKAAGGPEALINEIQNQAEKKKQSELMPVFLITPFLSIGIWEGIKKGLKYYHNMKQKKQKELEKVEFELLQLMKEYDRTHHKKESNENIAEKGEIENE